MSINFNADEIYALAIQIEKNGAAFYRKAMEFITDDGSQKFLKGLAVMEDGHVEVFSRMRADLTEEDQKATTFDPEGQTGEYLKVMAGGYVFKVDENPADRLTGKESMKDVLDIAIGLEKDSIVFYLGMKEMVSSQSGKGKVDAIIKEEMRHITMLSKELASL